MIDPIKQASAMDSLRNDQYFQDMLQKMELSLLAEVKRISRDVNISRKKKGDMLIQVADKICSLRDTMDAIDSFVDIEAENIKYEQETKDAPKPL